VNTMDSADDAIRELLRLLRHMDAKLDVILRITIKTAQHVQVPHVGEWLTERERKILAEEHGQEDD